MDFLHVPCHCPHSSGFLQGVHKKRIGGSGSLTPVRTLIQELALVGPFSDPPPLFASFYSPVPLGIVCRSKEQSWGLTDTSVALGCRPWSLSQGIRSTEAAGCCMGFCSCIIAVSFGFFRSLLVILFAALFKVFVQHLPGRQTAFARWILFPVAFAPAKCVTALAVASPGAPILQWSCAPSRRKSRRTQVSFLARRFKAVWLFVFGFAHMPIGVWSAPAHVSACNHLLEVLEGSHFPAPDPSILQPEHLSPPQVTDRPAVDLPEIAGAIPPYPPQAWLGVIVYAPLFQTIAFGLCMRPSDGLTETLAAITATGRLQCTEHDSLVPVQPQVMPGHLSVLSYPSIIAQGRRPHCAVLIDISRVGGACHAVTLPIDVRLVEFLELIRTLMNVDIETETVNVWVGAATQPATPNGALSVANGTLITVTRTFVRAPAIFHAETLFAPTCSWDRLDHVPKPSRAHCIAVCHSGGIWPVVLAFFPRYFKEDIALQVTRNSSESADVVLVDNVPVLELGGEPCSQTAVVIPKQGICRTSSEQPKALCNQVAYLLDVRPLGIAPRLVVSEGSLLDLPDIMRRADIEVPAGYCSHLIKNTVVGRLQHLYVGVTQDLATRVFGTDRRDVSQQPPEGSLPANPHSAGDGLTPVPPPRAGLFLDSPHQFPARYGYAPAEPDPQ